MPENGVASTFSQNLAKRTVTAIKKWREGVEKKKHMDYRLKQLDQDPFAQNALMESIEKNKTNRISLEQAEYIEDYLTFDNNNREWND